MLLPKPVHRAFPYLLGGFFLLGISLITPGCQLDSGCPEFQQGQIWADDGSNRYTQPTNALYAFHQETGQDVLQAQLIGEEGFSFAISLLSTGENTIGLGTYGVADSTGTSGACEANVIIPGSGAYQAVEGIARITTWEMECREVSIFYEFKMMNNRDSSVIDLNGAVQGALILIQEETE